MAKTESFFIRKTVDIGNTNGFFQGNIDLGSFVNALEKSVLRIHSIDCVYSDATGRSNIITANSAVSAQWQLTTQSQLDIVRADDRSLIASGKLTEFRDLATDGLPTSNYEARDLNPADWVNGYLVATDQIFLGGAASTDYVGDVYVTLVLECSVESMSQADAMSLALSQQ